MKIYNWILCPKKYDASRCRNFFHSYFRRWIILTVDNLIQALERVIETVNTWCWPYTRWTEGKNWHKALHYNTDHDFKKISITKYISLSFLWIRFYLWLSWIQTILTLRTEGVVVATAVPVCGTQAVTLTSLTGVHPRTAPARAGIWRTYKKQAVVNIQERTAQNTTKQQTNSQITQQNTLFLLFNPLLSNIIIGIMVIMTQFNVRIGHKQVNSLNWL